MVLSIVIPTYLRNELLEIGLQSIIDQNITEPYEIIVLNDAQPDESKNICKKFNVRYIFTGQRNNKELKWRCPGFAINIGIKKALGKLILITSPEIYYLTPNCLNKMIELALTNNKSLTVPEIGYDDVKNTFFNNLDFNRCNVLNIEYPFCMIIHKSELLNIGGYDESFTGFAYDDTDIVTRLLANGCTYQKALNHKIIHLFHGERTAVSRVGLVNKFKALEYNKNLYLKNSNIIKRNINKEWGKL